MRVETRYQMMCGPDGEWHLQAENLRGALNVYRSRLEPQMTLPNHPSPQVSLVSPGEAAEADKLSRARDLVTKTIPWQKRLAAPPRLRKPDSKTIVARGTL